MAKVVMDMSVEELTALLDEAEQKATEASKKFLKENLGGHDQFPCGFAWVDIVKYHGQKITGNSSMGKLLKMAGIDQTVTDRKYQLWCPGRIGCQNVYVIEAGAKAAAEVLENAGFEAKTSYRWD